ncbi:MAG: RNA polymerase sigma factor [Planctomycetota bacterium]
MAQALEATKDLVVRAQAGSREAFEKLVREHSGLVAAVAAAHMSDPAEVEDLIQETFMTAWREIARLRKPESFGPWVSAVARNLARAAAADRSRRSRLRVEAPGQRTVGEREGLYRRVLSEVEALPDGYREVFLLRYVADRDCASIACELGIALGTVTSRLSRGHAMLRQKLEREAR